jgi:hypothetical protein
MSPAVALKFVEVALAGTITEGAGIGSRLLLLANATSASPFGAAWFRVTVHVVAAPEFRLVGLHPSDDSVNGAGTGATSMIVAVCDAPFRLAVNIAL